MNIKRLAIVWLLSSIAGGLLKIYHLWPILASVFLLIALVSTVLIIVLLVKYAATKTA